MTEVNHDLKEDTLELSAELTVDQAIELAKGLQQRLALEEAETIYRRILAHLPEHPDALHFLGLLQYQRGRPEEAVRIISEALRIAPDYVDACNNLGNIYREQERLYEAESCYRRVIELTPRNAGAYNNLGTVLRARGLLSDAAAAYQKAIDLEPNFPNPFENMGNLLSRQGKVTEAVAHYSQAIVLNPDHPGCKKCWALHYPALAGRRRQPAFFGSGPKKSPIIQWRSTCSPPVRAKMSRNARPTLMSGRCSTTSRSASKNGWKAWNIRHRSWSPGPSPKFTRSRQAILIFSTPAVGPDCAADCCGPMLAGWKV